METEQLEMFFFLNIYINSNSIEFQFLSREKAIFRPKKRITRLRRENAITGKIFFRRSSELNFCCLTPSGTCLTFGDSVSFLFPLSLYLSLRLCNAL